MTEKHAQKLNKIFVMFMHTFYLTVAIIYIVKTPQYII